MPQSGEQLGGWWLRGAQRTGWLVTGPAQSQSSASCPRVHTSATAAWDNSNSSDTTTHQQNCDTTMASVRACLLVLASLASTQAVKHNKGEMSVIQPHS